MRFDADGCAVWHPSFLMPQAVVPEMRPRLFRALDRVLGGREVLRKQPTIPALRVLGMQWISRRRSLLRIVLAFRRATRVPRVGRLRLTRMIFY